MMVVTEASHTGTDSSLVEHNQTESVAKMECLCRVSLRGGPSSEMGLRS